MRCVVLFPAFLAHVRRRQVQQMAADVGGSVLLKGVIKVERN